MRNHASLPKKSERVLCTECRCRGYAPIVVADGRRQTISVGTDTVAIGRCSNRKACERRQLRIRNEQKAVK